MVARRYGIYLRVFTSISHSFAALTRSKSNVNTSFLTIFRRFPTTFRRFPKVFQNCSEGQTNVPEHFPSISENSRRCPKISEDSRRLSRKIRRCFADIPTNLSTIKETKLISEKLSISSHVKISYCYVCSDTTFLGGINPCKTLQFI